MKSLKFSGFLFIQNPVHSDWIVLFTIFFYRISTAKQMGFVPDVTVTHLATWVNNGLRRETKGKLNLYGFTKNMEKTTWK